jgi:hypothetical protein
LCGGGDDGDGGGGEFGGVDGKETGGDGCVDVEAGYGTNG